MSAVWDEPLPEGLRPRALTVAVYRVDAATGVRTTVRGEVELPPTGQIFDRGWPACECPRCRS